ncbi:MAG: hypothetical protein H6811_07700 [Phycisphaeraceae bacterium]|nr:hypothetical protein [Phycisphaeraceae bacterium]
MSRIDDVLARASRRLWVVRTLHALVRCCVSAAALTLAIVLVERIFRLSVPWAWVFAGAGVAVLIATLSWAWATRPAKLAVARIIDERADLRESLSTAMVVRTHRDAWSRAVVETAETRAGEVVMRDALPISPPPSWPLAPGTIIAMLLAWWLVPSAGPARERATMDSPHEIRQAMLEQSEAQKRLEELLRKARVDLGADRSEAEALDPEQPRSVEEVQRAALRKLTSAMERLEAQRQDADAQQLQSLRDELRKLTNPGPGPLDQLAQKLAQGDFGAARQALEQLQKQLENSDLTEAQRTQAEEQLKSLAEQLERAAQRQEQLEKQMREQMARAGMSQEQINQAMQSPQAMQEALQQLQNMSPQQRQQLMDQMQQMQACKSCSGMGQQMSQMAQQMAAGQAGGEQLGDMLSQLESMQLEMQAMDAAMMEAMDQMDQLSQKIGGFCEGMPQIGQWREGESDRYGQGSGGPGKGRGASTADSPFDFTTKSVKAPTANQGGPIIASTMIDGPTIAGESRAEFAAAVEQGEQAASEAIDTLVVPRELQGAVKSYFSSLQRQARDEP